MAALAMSLMAAAPLALAQRTGTAVQPGVWELLIETRSPSLAGTAPGQPRSVTGLKVCFGDAQATDPVTFISDRILPPARGCRITALRQSGPRVTWSLSCEADTAARGSATFEFSATRFSGTMRHETAIDPKRPDHSTFIVQARRLADC